MTINIRFVEFELICSPTPYSLLPFSEGDRPMKAWLSRHRAGSAGVFRLGGRFQPARQ
jgi:hypothetical protein